MIHINSGSSDCVNSMKGVAHKLMQSYYLWGPLESSGIFQLSVLFTNVFLWPANLQF